jgi:ABC-2 type transport system permease protein
MHVWTLTRKDLRLRLRDRSAVLLGVVAPLVIALAIGAAFANFDSVKRAKLVVVNLDGGPVGDALISALDSPPVRAVATVTRAPTVAAVRARLKSGAAEVGLIVPADFSVSQLGTEPAALSVLQVQGKVVPGTIGQAIGDALMNQVNSDRAAVVAAQRADPTLPLPKLLADVQHYRNQLQLVDRVYGRPHVRATSYYLPAMGLLFLFFTVSYGSRSLLQERTLGTLQRLHANGVSPRAIVASKCAVSVLLGCVSMGTIWLVGELVTGATWGDPVAVAVLLIASVLAISGITSLLALVATTDERASALTALVAFVLALAGGNFAPLSLSPPLIRLAGHLTPNGWALRGFATLVSTGTGVGSVAGPLLALSAFVIVLWGTTGLLVRRRVAL